MVKYFTQNNTNNNINRDDRKRGGILLTQIGEDNRGEIVPGSNGITIANKKCFRCNKFGHIAWNCTLVEDPIQGKKGSGMLQQGVSLFQKYNTDAVISETWILLDSCSTDTVFMNPDLVANIRTGRADEELRMLTNGGSVTYKDVADCKLLLLKVHFNKDSLANILSCKQVSEIPGVKITTYTPKEDALTVHLKDGKEMKFKCNECIYYYNTNSNNHSESKVNSYGVNMLNTVANNKLCFTKRQIKNAEIAR